MARRGLGDCRPRARRHGAPTQGVLGNGGGGVCSDTSAPSHGCNRVGSGGSNLPVARLDDTGGRLRRPGWVRGKSEGVCPVTRREVLAGQALGGRRSRGAGRAVWGLPSHWCSGHHDGDGGGRSHGRCCCGRSRRRSAPGREGYLALDGNLCRRGGFRIGLSGSAASGRECAAARAASSAAGGDTLPRQCGLCRRMVCPVLGCVWLWILPAGWSRGGTHFGAAPGRYCGVRLVVDPRVRRALRSRRAWRSRGHTGRLAGEASARARRHRVGTAISRVADNG